MKENNWHAHHHSSVLFRGRTENSPVIHTHKKLNDLQKILYIYTIFFLLKIETCHAKVIGDGLFRVNPSKVLIQWRQLNLVPRFPLHFSANKCKKLVFSARKAGAGTGQGACGWGWWSSFVVFRLWQNFTNKICVLNVLFSYLSNQRAEEQHSKQPFPYQHQLSHINCNLSPYGNIQLDTTIIKWTVKNSTGREMYRGVVNCSYVASLD